MNLSDFLEHLNNTPETINFQEVITLIEENYTYTPTAFTNGDTKNAAGTNAGSCKIFAFAQLHKLSEQNTLALFGTYYRDDVLKNPEGSDHANIRNFIKHGWKGIKFEGSALTQK